LYRRIPLEFYEMYQQEYNSYNQEGDGVQSNPPNDNLRKLFVGGLSPQSSRDSVKTFYEQFGPVSDVTLMIDPTTKKSRGFGFVTFETEGSVDTAQAARPHTIDGKQVDCKRAIPKDDPNPESRFASKKIFVGGMKREITQDQLQEYFSQYGTLTECLLVKDKATGLSRGFAFLTFEDTDTVDKVILHRPHTIGTSRADVKKALSKEELAQLKAKQQPATDGYNNYYQGWDNSAAYGQQPSAAWGAPANGGYQASAYPQQDNSGGFASAAPAQPTYQGYPPTQANPSAPAPAPAPAQGYPQWGSAPQQAGGYRPPAAGGAPTAGGPIRGYYPYQQAARPAPYNPQAPVRR
jgi:RNA recognition motif-containing protein